MVEEYLEHSGQEIQVTTPGYPNLYPLNAVCSWKYTLENVSGILTFVDVDLQPDHELHITQLKNGTQIGPELTFSANKSLPDDIFLKGDVVEINWSSSLFEDRSKVASKGFHITLRTFGKILLHTFPYV